jgi:hypothetical protein
MIERNNQITLRALNESFSDIARDLQFSPQRIRKIVETVLRRTIHEERIKYLCPKIALKEYSLELKRILIPPKPHLKKQQLL